MVRVLAFWKIVRLGRSALRTDPRQSGRRSVSGGGRRFEPRQPAQVVGRTHKREQPTDLRAPSQLHLLEHPDHLQPPEALLDSFPLLLADPIAWMPGGAFIQGAASAPRLVLCQVRGHLLLSQLLDELAHVVGLVRPQGHRPRPRDLPHHSQRRLALGRAGGLSHAGPHQQPVAVFHHRVPQIRQLGLRAFRLLVQSRLRVAGGQMRFVAALGAVKVHLAPVAARRWFLLALRSETLLAGPGLDQRPRALSGQSVSVWHFSF